MSEPKPKYAGYKPMMNSTTGTDQFSAVHLDQSLGCVLGSAVGDAVGSDDLIDWKFGPATSLSVVETLAFIEAEAVEATRPILFEKLQLWYTSFDKRERPAISNMVVGVTDPRGFEGAAERYLAAFPDRCRDSSVIARCGLAAARWLHAQDVGATQYVGRRFCGVTHANPAAMEARALLQAIVRWQRSAERKPDDPALHMEHALARAIPEYRGFVEEVLSPGTPDTWDVDGAWRCLSDAVDVVRSTDNFEDAIASARAAQAASRDLTTVVGTIAGTRYGASRIPNDFLEQLHGEVFGISYGERELTELHDRLVQVPSEMSHEILIVSKMRKAVRAGKPLSPKDEAYLRRFESYVVPKLDEQNDAR